MKVYRKGFGFDMIGEIPSKFTESTLSDDLNPTPASSLSRADVSWPGGWYIYENGRVDGPFTAQDAFKMDAETLEGKPRLISRKGFSQWYALKDLSEIFRMTDHMGKHAATEIANTEAQLSRAARSSMPAVPSTAKAMAAASMQKVSAQDKMPQSMARPASAPVQAMAEKKIEKKVERKADAPLATSPAAAEPAFPLATPSVFSADARQVVTKKAKPLARKAMPKGELMQGYFLARGRLRLGKLRNPWVTAFVGLPLSIGVYWALWFTETAREVAFHTRNEGRSPLPSGYLALIPGVHFFMIYKLAKLVSEMEAQNKYRSVSPGVAALFGVFPPFALAYIQDAVNRHWLMHTKHTLVKKRAEAEKSVVSASSEI